MSIRFAAIGFAHAHIYNITTILLDAGAELVSGYDANAEDMQRFTQYYPNVSVAASVDEILEDEHIDLVAAAPIPNERAALGTRVMEHGKDYLCAKPGVTSLQQLDDIRRVQAETGRIYSIFYGERFQNGATLKAGELVHRGAIGQVVQTVGFGPHRLLGHIPRADWVFDNQFSGGIINDLASHQMDQFLYFTGSTSAEVIAANVGNFGHKQFPDLHDFGDVMVRSSTATGYIRVDWLTPKGLDTWGDVRLFILGTDGSIEIRKNTDLAGRPDGNHLLLVDQTRTQYIDCAAIKPTFGEQLIHDIRNRTETAMRQAHCFLAAQLALEAQIKAFKMT